MMRNITWIMLAVFLSGVVLALFYRATDATRYASIGRYLHEEA
jgi:hypothetical protein